MNVPEKSIAVVLDPEDAIDPLNDIIDYLVRCTNISFKNSHVDQPEVRTKEKTEIARKLFDKSPCAFLQQFGKHLAPHHLKYFEELQTCCDENYRRCIRELKSYHSDSNKRKRVRNRRFNALRKLQTETDYFSEKKMMFRNPLLYEQLVGQYLTDEEIKERDNVDTANLTFLNMILETVDRNQMREMKNKQKLEEDLDSLQINIENKSSEPTTETTHWGDFVTPDTQPSHKPESRKQNMISAPERKILREEFYQEMYSNFMEGIDEDVDYSNIDNNEQYDDLLQISRDAEDKYFDSESNEVTNLEEHMKLIQEYGKVKSDNNIGDDTLDVFMKHITNKIAND